MVYSSRTHSQLAQVVRELRKTPYAAKAVVLGSRAHLCLHPDVKSLPSSAANTKCASLCQSQQCRWHKVYTQRQREPALAAQDYQPVADIEDLLTVGRGVGGGAGGVGPCPYYLSRAWAKDADVVLMPYNYLIDANTRKGLELAVPLSGSIVIMDEAHNVEQVPTGEPTPPSNPHLMALPNPNLTIIIPTFLIQPYNPSPPPPPPPPPPTPCRRCAARRRRSRSPPPTL